MTAMTPSSGDKQTDLKASNLALITNVELRQSASGNKIQLQSKSVLRSHLSGPAVII
jgi:hypothetical protein